jgi:hypothetical protein
MKLIDFTQPGGFPLTQDQLGYLQQAYKETITAVALIGGDGSAPHIISGMEISNPFAGTYTVTDGWFFYYGNMVRFNAGTVAGASGASDAFVVINNAAGPLIFNDGSAPNVIFDMDATLQVLPSGTPVDATHFRLSSLQPLGLGFGIANRDSGWKTLAISTPSVDGGVTGNVYYKKDFTANTLHLRGALTAANAQNFAASPGSLFYLMGSLPIGYIPSNNAYFSAYYYIGASIKDDLGVGWIKQVNLGLNNSGQLFGNWIKPEVAISSYGVNFSATISLD